MTANKKYYSQALIVSCMKLKLKLSVIKKYLILVIIRLNQNTMMVKTNYSLET